MGEFWDNTPNMGFEPGKSKWLAEGKLEELTHKSNLNCPEGVTQSLTSSVFLGAYPLCLSTRYRLPFLPNKYLTCFITIFMGIVFCRAEGPEPRHWPPVEWLGFDATHQDPTSSLAGRSPASSCTDAGHLRSLQRPCSKLRNFRKKSGK